MNLVDYYHPYVIPNDMTGYCFVMKDNELYVASEFTDNRYLVVIIGNRFSNPIKLTEETKIRARATMTKPCNWELALEEAESLRNQED